MPRLLALILGLCLSTASAAPRVVASIPPLHSLVAAVTEGVSEPHLLLRGGASPHTYSLLPSDIRALNGADALFWFGPELESFLIRPIRSLQEGVALPLLRAPGMRLLPAREGGAWEKGADHGHEHDHGLDEQEPDPHAWLDPGNASAMVKAIAAHMERIDPANRARYRANRDATLARLDRLDLSVKARLAPVREVPYVVFHDAYRYFEDHYGLNAVGSVTVNPEQRPGARRLVAIREKIRSLNARCVFSEPQFRSSLVGVVIEGSGARAGVLDPVGAGVPPGPDLYERLMSGLAEGLTACLGQAQ